MHIYILCMCVCLAHGIHRLPLKICPCYTWVHSWLRMRAVRRGSAFALSATMLAALSWCSGSGCVQRLKTWNQAREETFDLDGVASGFPYGDAMVN